MDVRCGRNPRLREVRDERRPVDPRLTATKGCAVLRIRHTVASAVRVDDTIQCAANAGHHLRQRRQVRGVVFGDQRMDVFWRQRVPPLVWRARDAVRLQQPGDGLLFQPLACVAERDTGGGGELGRCERAARLQCGVKTELLPEIHPVQLERVHRGFNQARRQRLVRRDNCMAAHKHLRL